MDLNTIKDSKIATIVKKLITQFPLTLFAFIGSILIIFGYEGVFEFGKLIIGMWFVTSVFLWLFEPEYFYSHDKHMRNIMNNTNYSFAFICCSLIIGVFGDWFSNLIVVRFSILFTVCGMVWFFRTLDAKKTVEVETKIVESNKKHIGWIIGIVLLMSGVVIGRETMKDHSQPESIRQLLTRPTAGSSEAAKLMATNFASKMMLFVDDAKISGETATVKIHITGAECNMTLIRPDKTEQNELGWLVDKIDCPK